MGMCQIPDFVKKTYGNHYEVIENVFKFLISKKRKITDNFMRLQLMKLDKLEGNVILYQIELQMLELGHMFQIKIIG